MFGGKILFISVVLLVSVTFGYKFSTESISRAVKSHPDGSELFRLFHPAFPLELLNTYDENTITSLKDVKDKIGDDTDMKFEITKLPWRVLPELGISKCQNVWSTKEIGVNFEKFKHKSHVLWAHKISKPEEGCLLLNHWKQRVIKLTSYDNQRGARGVEIGPGGSEQRTVVWPPMALEFEIQERHWQPVIVSPNLITEVLPLLPLEMQKAPWELIFLLLLSMKEDGVHKEEIQALFDTGMSPRQGLVAYLRLLRQVVSRTQIFDDIPEYRKIIEKEITL